MSANWLVRCALTTLVALAAPAGAEEYLSARPTLLVGNDNVEHGNFGTGLHLGLSGRSPEFGPNLTAEAEVSVLLGLDSGSPSTITSTGLA
jgi:hypothetical protein